MQNYMRYCPMWATGAQPRRENRAPGKPQQMKHLLNEWARWCCYLLVVFEHEHDPGFYCLTFFQELGNQPFIGLFLRVLHPGYRVLVFISKGARGKVGKGPRMSNGID